jgi:3-hydroxyisobutyrate dehydrogenase
MTGSEQSSVAVIGAGGTMGAGMARNLAAAGFEVRAWNRTPRRLEPLGGDRIETFEDAAEACKGADAVLTILSDGEATLEAASGGALEAAPDSSLWLQMGTIGADATTACEELAERFGMRFLDAPVLGTKKPAEDGELVVIASGAEGARADARPYFDAVGKRTIWLGEAGDSSRLKVAINSWIVAVVEGTAETLALARGLGVEPEALLDAIAGGPLELPYMSLKAKAMLSGDYTPSFRLELAAKDAGLADDAAREAGLDLPALAATAKRLDEAAVEHGDEDLAATFRLSDGGGPDGG